MTVRVCTCVLYPSMVTISGALWWHFATLQTFTFTLLTDKWCEVGCSVKLYKFTLQKHETTFYRTDIYSRQSQIIDRRKKNILLKQPKMCS